MFIQPGEQSQSIHFRHIDITQHDIYIGMLDELLQGVFPVNCENKFILMVPDFLTELLLDQDLEICLIVDY